MTFKEKIFLYLKGIAMGSADVVPGVSGGTIAFITGIYDELLETISNIHPKKLLTLKNEGFLAFWKEINGNFLLFLLGGVATSIISLAKLISYLLQYYPVLVWAFFFGLIIASILYIGKQISTFNVPACIGLVVGTLFVVGVSMMPPLGANSSFGFLIFAGFLASTAMILPGISGSFILLILGAYSLIINALGELSSFSSESIMILLPVAIGVALGLLSTSRFLSFLLSKYHNFMMSLLTGFLVGSLYKVWPWKKTILAFDKHTQSTKELSEMTAGNYHSVSAFGQTLQDKLELTPLQESNISPFNYQQLNLNTSSDLIGAFIMAFIGFSIIFIIEILAKKKHV